MTLALGCSQTAGAGPYSGIHPLQSDRFVLGLGGFFSSVSTHFRLDSKEGDNGTDLDFQDDLGYDDNDTLPAFVLNWRLSNNTRLTAEYFTVGQDTRHTIDKSIEWGDIDYQVGVAITSSMDLDVGRAFFGYSLIKDDTKELGLGVGLHYLGLDTSLSGSGSVDGVPVGKVSRSIDDWAVLPNIGGYLNYAFSPKWLFSARVDWISANVDDYDGTLWNVEAFIQYQAFDHFGIGAAYRLLDLELGADNQRKEWRTDLEYNGPMLFFSANF